MLVCAAPYVSLLCCAVLRIGLKRLHEAGGLLLESAPGEHMQFSLKWFKQEIINKYLAGSDEPDRRRRV